MVRSSTVQVISGNQKIFSIFLYLPIAFSFHLWYSIVTEGGEPIA